MELVEVSVWRQNKVVNVDAVCQIFLNFARQTDKNRGARIIIFRAEIIPFGLDKVGFRRGLTGVEKFLNE